jgi:hypothetical protein
MGYHCVGWDKLGGDAIMIVRKATPSDLPQYAELAQAFHAASPMHGSIGFDVQGYSDFYLTLYTIFGCYWQVINDSFSLIWIGSIVP